MDQEIKKLQQKIVELNIIIEKLKLQLSENEKKHNNKICSNVLSKPVLNEETIKIANKIKRKIKTKKKSFLK